MEASIRHGSASAPSRESPEWGVSCPRRTLERFDTRISLPLAIFSLAVLRAYLAVAGLLDVHLPVGPVPCTEWWSIGRTHGGPAAIGVTIVGLELVGKAVAVRGLISWRQEVRAMAEASSEFGLAPPSVLRCREQTQDGRRMVGVRFAGGVLPVPERAPFDRHVSLDVARSGLRGRSAARPVSVLVSGRGGTTLRCPRLSDPPGAPGWPGPTRPARVSAYRSCALHPTRSRSRAPPFPAPRRGPAEPCPSCRRRDTRLDRPRTPHHNPHTSMDPRPASGAIDLLKWVKGLLKWDSGGRARLPHERRVPVGPGPPTFGSARTTSVESPGRRDDVRPGSIR